NHRPQRPSCYPIAGPLKEETQTSIVRAEFSASVESVHLREFRIDRGGREISMNRTGILLPPGYPSPTSSHEQSRNSGHGSSRPAAALDPSTVASRTEYPNGTVPGSGSEFSDEQNHDSRFRGPHLRSS